MSQYVTKLAFAILRNRHQNFVTDEAARIGKDESHNRPDRRESSCEDKFPLHRDGSMKSRLGGHHKRS